MMDDPSQGLTALDFHPQPFVNPQDLVQTKRRRPSRPKTKPPNQSHLFGSTSQPLGSAGSLGCCTDGSKPVSSCIELNNGDGVDCCDSPASCDGDCDQCEDCFEAHKFCDEDRIQCVDECEECFDEHDQACGQHGQVCTETCDDCDFSCFDCIDWNAFEKDKSLGLSYSVPLLDQKDDFSSLLGSGLDESVPEDLSSMSRSSSWTESPAPPVHVPMHHQCLDSTAYWNGLLESQYCPTPAAIAQSWQQTQTFGCHPAALHQGMGMQQPLPPYTITAAALPTPVSTVSDSNAAQTSDVPMTDSNSTDSIICQWVMPCSNRCLASFASVADLKKHLKAVHCPKGTVTCSWGDCTASFATDAALTGHISKKHLADLSDASGPFKCEFPGCGKSFMYKQVRDDHTASHYGENKMRCPICKQWLNCEGSNFKRHMASHQPKHEHMMCKYHHLGCKRRFPRLDNLRRHEASCRFAKKASLHHHHYHKHVGHQS